MIFVWLFVIYVLGCFFLTIVRGYIEECQKCYDEEYGGLIAAWPFILVIFIIIGPFFGCRLLGGWIAEHCGCKKIMDKER